MNKSNKINLLEKEILENENIVIKMQGIFIIKKLKEGISEEKLNSWFNKLYRLYKKCQYKENEKVIEFLEEVKEKIKTQELFQVI